MDGEVGRFSFFTHSVLYAGQIQYNTGHALFTAIQAREFYRTTGFKEIAMIYGDTEGSYRKTTLLINRIRYQEQNGTPYRTLQENTEKEGTELLDHIEEKFKSILMENGFTEDGICQEDKEEYANSQPAAMVEEKVAKAIEKCRERCEYPDEIFKVVSV